MNKSTRINEILGAKIFQKYVFKLEKLKFIISDKLFPNVQDTYEVRLNKALDKALANETDEEKREKVLKKYHDKVLMSRKENNNKHNRNYHIDRDNPMEFVKYLENNKKIHKRGLISNGIIYLILIPLLITGVINPILGYSILAINTVHSFINFECVNLQNYNIKRFENNREKFEKMRKKREERDLEKYKDISPVIASKISSQREIPKPEEVVKEMTTKEQLEEMRNLLLSYKSENKSNDKVLRKGGRIWQH